MSAGALQTAIELHGLLSSPYAGEILQSRAREARPARRVHEF